MYTHSFYILSSNFILRYVYVFVRNSESLFFVECREQDHWFISSRRAWLFQLCRIALLFSIIWSLFINHLTHDFLSESYNMLGIMLHNDMVITPLLSLPTSEDSCTSLQLCWPSMQKWSANVLTWWTAQLLLSIDHTNPDTPTCWVGNFPFESS